MRMQNTFMNDGGQKVYQKYLDRYCDNGSWNHWAGYGQCKTNN